MSELTILEAMNKDLQLMLKREDKRDMQDEQLFPEHREMIEEIQKEPYTWLYLKLDAQPPEAYKNFTERLF